MEDSCTTTSSTALTATSPPLQAFLISKRILLDQKKCIHHANQRNSKQIVKSLIFLQRKFWIINDGHSHRLISFQPFLLN